ncbi:tRNA (adenine(22)-N(1))-methyltransferase [Peribacillus kribbensis]|uniref:tRNA (adenine(22)-N(1))-methyltransferase n=1 Tax=Peribacillus kribbensis TaxID=356658 RepID=UPI00041DBB16|nr:tRNA (adenine(22)-N(1))-methyltransferase TrmK [Peribacillus kribbensis]
MNIDKLSHRLEAVAGYIPPNSILADIGSDHAYLPCYAMNKGIIQRAVAGEVSEGPLRSALKQVQSAGLKEYIDVRKGDGLEVIKPGEVECITIAGMGGTLISSILERGSSKLQGVKRLILQPNIGAANIRNWLVENSWELVTEEILEEDQKIYEILVAERGEPMKPYQVEKEAGFLMGPFLMKEKSDVFLKKWAMELEHMKRILLQLDQAGETESLKGKKEELQSHILVVEGVLQK